MLEMDVDNSLFITEKHSYLSVERAKTNISSKIEISKYSDSCHDILNFQISRLIVTARVSVQLLYKFMLCAISQVGYSNIRVCSETKNKI